MMTAPADLIATVTWSSSVAMLSSNTTEPKVWRTPATMFRSLIGIGTPVSGGSRSGSAAAETAFSAARA